MTIEVQPIQRIRAFVEASFGADSSASIASFTDLPIIEGSAQMVTTRDELDPMFLVQHIDEGRLYVLGKRSATLTFAMNLAPTGTAATNGVISITSPLGMILKDVMGGEALYEGSVASTGSTASVINVSSGDGGQWGPGKVMGWTNSSGITEWREVESVATDAVTLKHGFSGSPSSTNPLYGAATYYMTANPANSFAFLVEGLENEDRFLLTGGQATGGFALEFNLTGGAIPKITFTFTFAQWYAAGETSSSITGTLGTASYTATNPIVGESGEFRLYTVGQSTLVTSSLMHVSAMTWEPHIAFGAYTSPSGKNTVNRWVKTKAQANPVQGSFTLPYQDTTYFALRNARTSKDVNYVAGVAAGSALMLTAPTVQVLNPQRTADASGLSAQVITWMGRRDTDVGATTTDLAKSPFRIHLC